MSEPDITPEERYQILLHRQGKEPTKALPKQAYGDPAKAVEFEASRKKLKKFHRKK